MRRTLAKANDVLTMMRWMQRGNLLLLAIGLLGCGASSSTPNRVVLPQGIKPNRKALAAIVEKEKSAPASFTQTDPEVKVQGACRYDERSIACWTPTGEPDPKLTGQLRAMIQRRTEPLPTTFGRKNRILVVDTPADSESRRFEEANVITHGAVVGSAFASEPRVRRLIYVSEPGSALAATLRMKEVRRLPQTIRLELKKGATANVGDWTVTTVSVTPLDARDPMTVALPGAKGWKIVARAHGGKGKPPQFTFVDPYPIQTMDGSRVRINEKTHQLEKDPGNSPRLTFVGGSDIPEGDFSALIDRDPKKARTIEVRAETERLIEIPGISLDSK